MELRILLAIQSVASPLLDGLMTLFTLLGDQIAAVLVISIVYWLWDKETGEYLAFGLLVSLSFNGLIKNLLRFPRPIGQPGVRSLHLNTAPGYSFPSGHAQTAATLYSSLAFQAHRRTVTVLAVVLPVLAGLSRMYLGVHWLKDVLVGWGLGFLAAGAVYLFFCSVLDEARRERVFLGAALVFLLPALLLQEESFLKAYGLLVGFSVGVWLEHHYVKFTTEGLTPRRRFQRWTLGIVLLAVVKIGLSWLLPNLLFLVILEYAAVAFCAFFVCPMLFVALRW